MKNHIGLMFKIFHKWMRNFLLKQTNHLNNPKEDASLQRPRPNIAHLVDMGDDRTAACKLLQNSIELFSILGEDGTYGYLWGTTPGSLPTGSIIITRLVGQYSNDNMLHLGELIDQGFLQHVTDFEFYGSNHCSDIGLAVIAKFAGLQILELDDVSKITNQGVCDLLGNLPALKALTINCSQLSDDAFVPIANMTELTTLDLRYTQLTDACLLKYLMKAPKLTKLDVTSTRVTTHGNTEARNIRQKLEIVI